MTQNPEQTPVEPTVPLPPVDQPTTVIPPAGAPRGTTPAPSGPAPVAATPTPSVPPLHDGRYAPAGSVPPSGVAVPPAVPESSRPLSPGAPPAPPQRPSAMPQGTPDAHGGPGASDVGPTPPTAQERRKRGWVPVVSAAAIAAVLASAGTVGLVTALDGGSPRESSLAQLGAADDTAHTVPVANSTSENPDWEAVTKAVSQSVVAIQVTTSQGSGEGSGVVYDKDGHILTNNHVVSGAQQIQVTLSDGTIHDAEIVGTDPVTDLAVIKLQDPPEDLAPATFGDSSKVSVGEPVLAVGNPLGLANTATTGIVSAVDRPVSASGDETGSAVVTNAIQIDAAVNPGNSGGPLFNAQGEVIGITSSIASLSSGSSQSGSIGLGFSIPIDLASDIGAQLIESGTAEHAFLGVSLSDTTATADGVTRRGAKVEQVTDGSPAAEAGIRSGDVIVGIGDKAVGGAESLTGYVREMASGTATRVTLVRDGETLEIDVTLAAKPADTTDSGSGQGDSGDGSSQGGSGQGGVPGQQDDSGGSDPTNPGNLPWPFGDQG